MCTIQSRHTGQAQCTVSAQIEWLKCKWWDVCCRSHWSMGGGMVPCVHGVWSATKLRVRLGCQ